MQPPTTLTDLADLYCTVNTRCRSPGTHRLHRFAAASYGGYLEREALLADLSDLTYARWLVWRSARASPATVSGEARKLLAAWRWAAAGKRQWIDGPDVTAPQSVAKLPRALTRSQLELLWLNAEQSQCSLAGVPYRVYFTALLYVLWDTSERIGAVLQLRREEIAGDWLAFPAGTRKDGRPRAYKIRQRTVAALDELSQCTERPQLFALRSQSTINYHWRRLIIDAGLPAWVTPHTIRRCHATHAEISGADPSQNLGHSSRQVTVASYIDPVIVGEHRPQPCDLLFDPGRRSTIRAIKMWATGS